MISGTLLRCVRLFVKEFECEEFWRIADCCWLLLALLLLLLGVQLGFAFVLVGSALLDCWTLSFTWEYAELLEFCCCIWLPAKDCPDCCMSENGVEISSESMDFSIEYSLGKETKIGAQIWVWTVPFSSAASCNKTEICSGRVVSKTLTTFQIILLFARSIQLNI